MTLMPEADYREVLATLLDDMIMMPWRRAHHGISRLAIVTNTGLPQLAIDGQLSTQ